MLELYYSVCLDLDYYLILYELLRHKIKTSLYTDPLNANNSNAQYFAPYNP